MRWSDSPTPDLRFPAVSARTAQWPLRLPPFPGFPQGWSGTLEEFLSAVRQQDIELEKAPLAAVVDQYLRCREGLEMDEAGEFLHVASSLIEWKTRLLLPRDPVLAEADPRQEIVRALEVNTRHNRKEEGTEPIPETRDTDLPHRSLLDLMVLLHEVEQASIQPSTYGIALPAVTVADQLCWIREHLAQLNLGGIDSEVWFELHPSVAAKLCLFLALLELSRHCQIRLEQSESLGPLF